MTIVDRFGAMGTQVEVHGADESSLDEVRVWFGRVEACCSRFRPDSELSRLNRSHGAPVRVSPLLAEILEAASGIRRLTGGLVDPGVGERVAAWGYDRTFAEVVGLAERPDSVPSGDWEIRGDLVTLQPGARLDLGGIAKGWACDRAVERGLASMVSAGGDLRSAQPGLVVDVHGTGGGILTAVPLGEGGLATSSTARRRWEVAGRTVSHVIDPRTGEPAETPVVSATAMAATALEAEAAAKAVLLLGPEGLGWADRQPWVRQAVAEWAGGMAYATSGEAA